MSNSANPEMEKDGDAEGEEEEEPPKIDAGTAELGKKLLEGKENLSNKGKGSTS